MEEKVKILYLSHMPRISTHNAVLAGQWFKLCRWTGSEWESLASGEAPASHLLSAGGLAPIAGETYNAGVFALFRVEHSPFVIVVR